MNKEKLLASAQNHVRKGQHRKAIADYERIVQVDTGDIRTRLKLADLYYREKDTDRAVASFVEVAELYEQDGFALKAVAVYKQVLKIATNRHDLFVALANNYQQLGLQKDAVQQYRAALRLLDQQGDRHGKLHVIQQMLALDPDNIRDRVRLAEAYSASGQMTEAVREFRAVSERLNRAGAEADFRRVAERLLYHQPDDATVARQLARSYVAEGRPAQALPKLKIAFRNAPRDLEVLDTLARAFEGLGQSHKSVSVLKEMVRLYRQSGLENEQRDCWQRIVALSPDDPEGREALGTNNSEQAGATIEFEESGPLRPPTPGQAPAPAAYAAAPAPRPEAPRASVSAADDPESLIDEMIRQALGDEADALVGPSARRAAPMEIEAVVDDFDDDFDDDDDDDDDDVGFGGGPAEQTIVDNHFIPEDVMAQAPGGMNLVVPQAPAPETFARGEELLREELQELDFYIQSGLADEAKELLRELEGRWGRHPYLQRRADGIAALSR